MADFSRHEERIMALKILYGLDIREELVFDRAEREIENFKRKKDFVIKQEKEYYFEKLIYGVIKKKEKLDKFINKFAEGWTVDRMAHVDRNILRIALFEMEEEENVPPAVAVDEAVELAKKFASEKTSSFINGILSRSDKFD